MSVDFLTTVCKCNLSAQCHSKNTIQLFNTSLGNHLFKIYNVNQSNIFSVIGNNMVVLTNC